MRNLLFTTLAALGLASGAHAATVTEITDFPDVRQIGGAAIATLDVGINTVRGSLGGTCITGPGGGIDCNTAFGIGEDNQDSFILDVAADTVISSIFYSLIGSGPSFATAKLSITDVANSANSFTGSDFLTSSGFIGVTSIGPGSYFFDVFGSSAQAQGAYNTNWQLTFNVGSTAPVDPNPDVSEVPLPAPAFLLMGGIAGLGVMKRRKMA